MSRGMGARQREVLAAIDKHAATDVFERGEQTFRARWRWHTLDRLGLTTGPTTRSRRSALTRAVRTLASTGELEITDYYPYAWFLGPDEAPESLEDQDDLAWRPQLQPFDHHEFDPFPPRAGRSLWFRRVPPSWDKIPEDDQTYLLDYEQAISEVSDDDQEYIHLKDREAARQSEWGQWVNWLLHGHVGVR